MTSDELTLKELQSAPDHIWFHVPDFDKPVKIRILDMGESLEFATWMSSNPDSKFQYELTRRTVSILAGVKDPEFDKMPGAVASIVAQAMTANGYGPPEKKSS